MQTVKCPEIGARIRRRRVRLGLTLEEVGRRAGLSKGAMSRAENGADVRASTLRRIAQALRARAGDLLG